LSPPTLDRAGDSGARIVWIIVAILTLVLGWSYMLLPAFAWVFGAPVNALASLAIGAGFAVVGTALCVAGARLSRARMLQGLRSWWLAALTVVALVLLWIIAGRLLYTFAYLQ
jgi:hypothetical protein